MLEENVNSRLQLPLSAVGRRRFLTACATGITGYWVCLTVPRAAAQSSAKANAASKEELLRGLAAFADADTLSKRPQTAADALLALGAVYERAFSAGTSWFSRNSTLNDISRLVNTASLPDVGSIKGIQQLLTTHAKEDLFAVDGRELSRNTGLLIQSAGAFGGLFSPPAGVALSLLGTWAEPTLTYLAQPGLDLTRSLFPETDPSRMEVIALWAFDRTAHTSVSNTLLRDALQLPALKSRVGINLDASEEAIISKLPAAWRQEVKALIDAKSAGEVPVTRVEQTQKFLQKRIEEGFAGLNERVAKTEVALAEFLEQERRAKEIQAQRQHLIRTEAELRGSIDLGAFLLDRILNDKQAVRAFYSTATAAQKAFSLIGQFKLGDIGTLAFAGSMAGLAGSLLSGFGGGQDAVAKALEQINAQLNQISTQLSRIEATQAEILTNINRLYVLIQANSAEARGLLNSLQNKVDRLAVNTSDNPREQEKASLFSALGELSRLMESSKRDQAWRRDYERELGKLQDYATNRSKTPYMAGAPDGSLSSLVADLLLTPRADLAFAALPRLCTWVEAPINSQLPAQAGRGADRQSH